MKCRTLAQLHPQRPDSMCRLLTAILAQAARDKRNKDKRISGCPLGAATVFLDAPEVRAWVEIVMEIN